MNITKLAQYMQCAYEAADADQNLEHRAKRHLPKIVDPAWLEHAKKVIEKTKRAKNDAIAKGGE